MQRSSDGIVQRMVQVFGMTVEQFMALSMDDAKVLVDLDVEDDINGNVRRLGRAIRIHAEVEEIRAKHPRGDGQIERYWGEDRWGVGCKGNQKFYDLVGRAFKANAFTIDKLTGTWSALIGIATDWWAKEKAKAASEGVVIDPDDVQIPTAKTTVAKDGDILVFDDGQLTSLYAVGNSGDSAFVGKIIQVANALGNLPTDTKARLGVADLPYNVAYEDNRGRTLKGDKLPATEYWRNTREILRVMAETVCGDQYWFNAYVNIEPTRNIVERLGITTEEMPIILPKDRIGKPSPYHYHPGYEVMLYGWTRAHSSFTGSRNQTTTWNWPEAERNKLRHPTQKPVKLIERIIQNSSLEGDLVFDPCGGAGTTLIACQQTGRRAVCIDVDAQWADACARWWQKITGKKVRFADGRLFDDAEKAVPDPAPAIPDPAPTHTASLPDEPVVPEFDYQSLPEVTDPDELLAGRRYFTMRGDEIIIESVGSPIEARYVHSTEGRTFALAETLRIYGPVPDDSTPAQDPEPAIPVQKRSVRGGPAVRAKLAVERERAKKYARKAKKSAD